MSEAARDYAARFVFALVCATWCTSAVAYRPFEGTDAAVADRGEFELELGPLQSLREGSERSLIAPQWAINYGVAKNWEAVWEGEVVHDRFEDGRTRLVGNGASLKGVVREGSLQDRSGPSVATEVGLLLPGINDEHGTGARIAGIVSYRWPFMTAHFNVAGSVTRDHNRDSFIGVIVEGPQEWSLRPVAEVFHEHEVDVAHTNSVLIGAIWRARDRLSFDVGLREANMTDQRVRELRAGLTYAWSSH